MKQCAEDNFIFAAKSANAEVPEENEETLMGDTVLSKKTLHISTSGRVQTTWIGKKETVCFPINDLLPSK